MVVLIGFIAGASNGFMFSNSVSSEFEPLPQENETDENENVGDNQGDFIAPPADAGAFERIEFSLNVMQNGLGFTAQMSQEVVSMGQKQKIFNFQYRGEGYDLSEEWQFADFAFGKNQFLSYYCDGQNVSFKKITDKENFSYQNKTYNYNKADETKNYTVNDYVQSFTKINDLQNTINESTSTIIKYDKRTNEKYYIIGLKLNTNKIDETYINSFIENGAQGVSFSSVTITLKINKKTGFLYRVERDEIFSTRYFGMNVSCTAKMVQIFTSMNVSAKAKIFEIHSKSFQ